MTRAEINVIIEQIKQGTFDFNFDASLDNTPVVGSQSAAPTASAGVSAPIITG